MAHYWRNTLLENNLLLRRKINALVLTSVLPAALSVMLSFNANAEIVSIVSGVGKFWVDGGIGREQKTINVHYYMPVDFSPASPILLVLHGNNRNAQKLRDNWIKASQKYGVLVLAPEYSKEMYPKSAHYHLANMVKVDKAKSVHFTDSSDWIFSDFDRIFGLAKIATHSQQTEYDLFGHSAGGQLAHRFVIFHPNSLANRVVAANAGWYTRVDFNMPFPYGLDNSPLDTNNNQTINVNDYNHRLKASLALSLSKNMTILLGDNDKKSTGSIRRNEMVDKQGINRVARGESFFNNAKQQAEQWKLIFNWHIEMVPNVGHSSSKMSAAAAEYLYAEALDKL